MSELEIERLGRVPYQRALDLQLDLVSRRARGEIGDRLLLLEHDEVFTCGRATSKASLPRGDDVPIVRTSRGGNVTWHGPGQIVGYWIRGLAEGKRDLHAHLRLIEKTLGETLAGLGLERGNKRRGFVGTSRDFLKASKYGNGYHSHRVE